MSNTLPIKNSSSKKKLRTSSKKLGETLISLGKITPPDLIRALALQKIEDAKLGEILHAYGFTAAGDLIHSLEVQYNLPHQDISFLEPNEILRNIYHTDDCLALQFIPISLHNDRVCIALYDPSQQEKIRALQIKTQYKIDFVIANKADILEKLSKQHQDYLVQKASYICPEKFSCRSIFTYKKYFIFVVLCLAIISIFIYFNFFWHSIFLIICLATFLNSTLRFICFLSYINKQKQKPQIKKFLNKMQKVSILIPILHETEILGRLIPRMQKLTYPKSLLDICLIIEETDLLTIEYLKKYKLPFWMRILIVPKDKLQTKPRAMNYALDFCKGDIIGIYDAEDAPEADQIYKAVIHLQNGPKNLACVQASLDYYNARTNWLSRCFSIEYAILFRLLLPALDRLSLPILLGGTSVFFKRDALEKLGRWDAHNVTEDADLGIRLYRKGYRCQRLDSTTYEEANFHFLTWVKQRSRWLKGYMLTWFTHMRNPKLLLSELGLSGFIVFNTLLISSVLSYLAIPFIIPLWLLSFGFNVPIYDFIPLYIINITITGFILAEVLLMVLSFFATQEKHLKHLRWIIPTLFFYWPLGSFAAYKALFELIFKPNYWDKTSHGINDKNYESEIEKLTSTDVEAVKKYYPIA